LYNWFYKKSRVSTLIYHTNCKEGWAENCCEGGLCIDRSPSQRKEEYDQRLVSYKTKDRVGSPTKKNEVACYNFFTIVGCSPH